VSVLEPPYDPAIIQHVSTQPCGGYQEYLGSLDARFSDARVERFCGPDAGILFSRVIGKNISALATMRVMDWDSELFGFGVAAVGSLCGSNSEGKATLLEEIIGFANDHRIRLLTCRIAYDDLTSLHALESTGFRVVDAMSVFLWDRGRNDAITDPSPEYLDLEIRTVDGCDPETLAAIREMAADSFHHHRMRNDPNVSGQQATRYTRKLASSILSTSDSHTVEGWLDGKPAGFVIGAPDRALNRHLDHPIGYLWLIARDPSAPKGTGTWLLRSFLQSFSKQVCFIEVGTQIDNYPALNLYARCGLQFVSSLITMHRWLQPRSANWATHETDR
jgi:ribosomal protein S18 acetylase RimI-like enzyme